MLVQAAIIGKSIPVVLKEQEEENLWHALSTVPEKLCTSNRTSDGKGKYMHPYALVHGLAISASVLYLTEFSRESSGTFIPFSHSSSEILLCFFRCRKECAQERCKRNLVFFWEVFNVLVCCSPVAPANSAGSQSSLLLEKMYARFI